MSPTPSEKEMAAALVFGLTSFSKPRFIRSLTGAGLIRKDYLLAMERSPIRDIEIKHILKTALTDDINSREVYMKGIDHSYYYEGYAAFRTEEL